MIIGLLAGLAATVFIVGALNGFRMGAGTLATMAVDSLTVLITIGLMVIFITMSDLGWPQVLVTLAVISMAASILVGRRRTEGESVGPVVEVPHSASRPQVRTGWSTAPAAEVAIAKPKAAPTAQVGPAGRDAGAEELMDRSFKSASGGDLKAAVAAMRELAARENDPQLRLRALVNLAWLQKSSGNRAGAIIELQRALECARMAGDTATGESITKMIRDLAYR